MNRRLTQIDADFILWRPLRGCFQKSVPICVNLRTIQIAEVNHARAPNSLRPAGN